MEKPTTPFRRERHPQFDEYFETHQKLFWWWSNRIARILNRAVRRLKWSNQDFIGWLVIWFNDCLFRFDPKVAKFTTFFSNRILSQVIRHVVQKDCETKPTLETYANYKQSLQYKHYHESGNRLYRIAVNNDWTEQILELLGDDPFTFLTRTMKDRYKTVLELRYKHGKTLKEIGDLLGVSKQRIEQIENRALGSIRLKLIQLEPVRELFFGSTTTEDLNEEVESQESRKDQTNVVDTTFSQRVHECGGLVPQNGFD